MTTNWIADNNRNVFSHSSEDRNLKSRCQQDHAPSEGWILLSCFFLASGSCWQSLAFLDMGLHHFSFCLCLYKAIFPLSMCVSSHELCIRTAFIVFRAHPNSVLSPLEEFHPPRLYFQIRSHSRVLDGNEF